MATPNSTNWSNPAMVTTVTNHGIIMDDTVCKMDDSTYTMDDAIQTGLLSTNYSVVSPNATNWS